MLVKCEVNVNINIFKSDCWGERTYVILSDFSVAFCSRNYKVFFFWSMARDEASLMKLNKEELVRITMDYQGKFDGVLDDYLWLKNDLSELKSDFSKLEADIQVIINVNTKLSEPLLQWKEGATLTNSILGGNVWKFWVFLQALLIITLNQKFWKF